MKKDLDSLMQAKNIDALLITGSAMHNPPMYYMTGGCHLTRADLIKKRNEEPILFYQSMEREEAAKSGLKSKCLDDYDLHELIKQAGGDAIKARILLYQAVLAEFNLSEGNLAIYGKIDAGQAYAIFNGLQQSIPGLHLVNESGESLLSEAMLTKDLREIELIREIGQITTKVVGNVADYLTSHRVVNEQLVKKDGRLLTIGDVKQKINLWLAELGAENPEQTIFSIGREAGVPHSTGNPEDIITLGTPIIFDIYPCQAGGGYFYDLTRTWSLGYAPDNLYHLYEDVKSVFDHVMAEMKSGSHCPVYQQRACELFEAKEHPTVKSSPKTLDGYVHSLGHGVGLNVHERPWFGDNASATDVLLPGVVFTVEPGLYYPDKAMGVRLEDTVMINPEGFVEVLAPYSYDLVLPVNRG